MLEIRKNQRLMVLSLRQSCYSFRKLHRVKQPFISGCFGVQVHVCNVMECSVVFRSVLLRSVM